VSCTAATGIDDAVLTLGDGDDRARVGAYPASNTAWLDGGSGNDVLISRTRFRDIFVGGPGNDTMTSAAFAAIFDEGSRANGHDTVSSDRPRSNAWAWVDYGKRARPIHADLDGRRDDGEAGERDLIGHGVTSIRGGERADHITGNGAPNRLVGGGGADVLSGGGGRDALVATDVRPPIVREPGVDVPQSPTSDRLLGGPGEDLLEGSLGANELDGGPGADRILGLAGPDRIRAQDGAVDRIECGADSDRAWNDAIDFRTECERVAADPPGAVPVAAYSFFEENRYPGDGPSRWVASVTVGCSVQVACTGSVDVLLDGQVVGTGPFSITSPNPYAEVWVEVTQEVAALIRRRDPRISATVSTGGTGVRRQAELPVLGRLLPILPIINTLPLGSG
jgi:Ca2+-binding RTX toxin-like protein